LYTKPQQLKSQNITMYSHTLVSVVNKVLKEERERKISHMEKIRVGAINTHLKADEKKMKIIL